MDVTAGVGFFWDIEMAKNIFNKTIVPVNINEIAEQGGVLNCISWEDE